MDALTAIGAILSAALLIAALAWRMRRYGRTREYYERLDRVINAELDRDRFIAVHHYPGGKTLFIDMPEYRPVDPARHFGNN